MNASTILASDFDGDTTHISKSNRCTEVLPSDFDGNASSFYSRAQWLEWSKKHPQTIMRGEQVFDLFEDTEMNFPDEKYPTLLVTCNRLPRTEEESMKPFNGSL